MLDSMDSMELAEWAEWERLNGPLGSVRQTVIGAGISHIVALCHSKKGTTYKASEFFALPTPDSEKPKKFELKGEKLLEFFKAWAGQGSGV